MANKTGDVTDIEPEPSAKRKSASTSAIGTTSTSCPTTRRLTPFLKKYMETMGWKDLNWLEDVHLGYEEGRAAVFDRNINGWVTVPEDMKLPDNQQDRDMIARELLIKFQMSQRHPMVDLRTAYQKVLRREPMTLPAHSKYVVIGAGIHGLSTAYHLALQLKARGRGDGSDILIVDKTGVAAGASGIACGVVRNNYFQPAMRQLMAHSVEVWESDPEAYSYHPVGYMQISPEVMHEDVASIAKSRKRSATRPSSSKAKPIR